ncbi:energy transducer TonB [candidate division FCPU426 bacterium]|nr:energy transducer TonB [candidate division FCPU426 bacterium]
MTRFFYHVDTGPSWSYRIVGASIVITLAVFMILPLLEIMRKPVALWKLREVDILEVRKPPPRLPPPVRDNNTLPKPRLTDVRRTLDPLQIQAALELDPGFADFGLYFNLRQDLGKEALVFEITEVDVPPKPLSQIMPLYPLQAKLKGIEGKVICEVVVQADGSVDAIKVVSSTPGNLFAAAAVNAVAKWRFQPGTRAGQPVATRVIVPLVFALTHY